MAGIAYPTWAYNSAGQASVIVTSATAFAALGGLGSWSTTPYYVPPASVPVDAGLTNTDTRLQQMLIEQRVTNLILQYGLNVMDDPQTQLRAEVLANDSSLVS